MRPPWAVPSERGLAGQLARRDELADGPTHELLARVAEDSAASGVDIFVAPVGACDEDPIGRAIEELAEALLLQGHGVAARVREANGFSHVFHLVEYRGASGSTTRQSPGADSKSVRKSGSAGVPPEGSDASSLRVFTCDVLGSRSRDRGSGQKLAQVSRHRAAEHTPPGRHREPQCEPRPLRSWWQSQKTRPITTRSFGSSVMPSPFRSAWLRRKIRFGRKPAAQLRNGGR